MNKKIMLLLMLIAILFITSCKNNAATLENIKIEYLGEAAGFKLVSENKVIYIDPYKLPATVEQKADQIYITHGHFDSCSPEDIAKITGVNTWFIGSSDCAEKVKDIKFAKLIVLDPGYNYNINGVSIDTIRAYNINNSFHPFANNWFGYVWNFAGKKIYYSSFTDYIPEIAGLENIDVAILIINGIDSLNTEDALKFIKTVKPKKVVAIGYSSANGKVSISDFVDKCNCNVINVE